MVAAERDFTPSPERHLRIAVADRDADAADQVSNALRSLGFEVRTVARGRALLALVEERWPDVVLLEVILADVNGLVICGQIRAQHQIPIVVYSASMRKDDRALSLMVGADDFIAKVTDVHEIQARIESILRRGPAPGARRPASLPTPFRRVGTLLVDVRRGRVAVGDKELALTPTEFRLLSAFAELPGHAFSRRELCDAAWGMVDSRHLRSVDGHVRRLRAKLRLVEDHAPGIFGVSGYGYVLLPTPDEPTEGH